MTEFNYIEALKGVLGGVFGGPSVGFANNQFILYVWRLNPTDVEVLCYHEDWDEFLKLCAEYSDYVPGDDHD